MDKTAFIQGQPPIEAGLVIGAKRKAFCSYILSRLKEVALESDPAFPWLEDLASELGVPLDIRVAQGLVHTSFTPKLARGVEELLTGEVWSEAQARFNTSG